jgi:hypothetical protein
VTVALCSRIDASVSPARLRTVVVDDETTDEGRRRQAIEDGQRSDSRWAVLDSKADTIRPDERSLAKGLAEGQGGTRSRSPF